MGAHCLVIGREVTWDEMLKSTEVWDVKIDLNKLR